ERHDPASDRSSKNHDTGGHGGGDPRAGAVPGVCPLRGPGRRQCGRRWCQCVHRHQRLTVRRSSDASGQQVPERAENESRLPSRTEFEVAPGGSLLHPFACLAIQRWERVGVIFHPFPPSRPTKRNHLIYNIESFDTEEAAMVVTPEEISAVMALA